MAQCHANNGVLLLAVWMYCV